ncbi:valyl-tRNA synthetase [Anaerobranca californiensis DSM 14826]|uniref:Valine--tRNA ligase n=1 Tax=Anaerobranca californiensis DSM 14826 TaxID=1120989 RepID=A0A1M6NMV9_9FIRM|nr:valine--tRNA ligase [Anaerobranca californiensis]SHJ97079.1 valyl-tRNA synthetase [Anaerobranca californiensis DSM 14826]
MEKVYDPKSFEEKWYNIWSEQQLFKPSGDKTKETFTIVIPPPNVTGALHMGHALDNTLQDILIRWKRMQGYDTLWVPGTDHAGIATQIKVEEHLKKEHDKTRHDLGREKFLDLVWKWKEEYHQRITSQLKKLGVSCDWSRERFTLDEGCSEAVKTVFVELYKRGLIYRGKYIINWCPRCQTALSDIEVEHIEKQGNLWHIKYPVENSDQYLVVATTRPETMLGDTGVAVNPKDERYRELIGKNVILPITNRIVPIVADEYVDAEFGTGAVKVTPAHDPNDHEIAKRHGLPSIVVIDEKGKMTGEALHYQGMDRFQCRKELIKELEDLGYLLKVEDHLHSVGHCERCSTIIEPYYSDQWFVKMKPLAQPAIEKVKSGEIKFIPERFARIYLNWVENVRDWCISRQIWWGHRIPAWYCECGEIIVERETPTLCGKCGGTNLKQDEDVLDTWFSSALWPFSTLGWPDNTPDFQRYFPTSVLVTGYDIIYFWVARMIFTSLEFTKQRPFEYVYIHGLVRDAQGRKMSKSLGNGVDPLDIIDKYGTDTLRFTLITGIAPGNDIRFSEDKVENSRNFANKIWNAARFVLMNLQDFKIEDLDIHSNLTLADKWILSRLNTTIQNVNKELERFELGNGAKEVYDFLWNEFCDWYIEITKPRLYGDNVKDKKTAQSVLVHVLTQTMKLLHPFMPFISEEIYSFLPTKKGYLITENWPEVDDRLIRPEIERQFSYIMEIIKGIRNVKSEMNVASKKDVEAIIVTKDKGVYKEIIDGEIYIKPLAGLKTLVVKEEQGEKIEKAVTLVVSAGEIFLPLSGLIDLEQEIQRLNKEIKNLDFEVERIQKKLENPGFVQKAPQAVIEKEKAKMEEYMRKRSKIIERLQELKG